MKLPFNPWTDTRDDAIAEDKRRKPIIKHLISALKKHVPGSEGWQELQYRLDPFRCSAEDQRAWAELIKQKISTDKPMPELELMHIIQNILAFGLVAPAWIRLRLAAALGPITCGEKKDFEHWKTGGSSAKRRKRFGGLQCQLFAIVIRLLNERTESGKRRYTTGKNDDTSVWEPAAKLIEREFDVSGYSKTSAYADYYDFIKRFIKP